jgi:flagellar protein FliO/FliZ
MFDTLFGAEISPALKFFLAFVIVLVLIGVTAWLVRRFGAERFGGSSARGRQPRLAVVDAAAVDGRRKLVIIRRDNVEHLLMIGGPTDVVVEQNIVRAMSAPRDKAEPTLGRGVSVSETLTRPVPLGEGTMWPLQPQPETNGRAPRAVPEEPMQWTWPVQPEPQRNSRPEPRLEKPDTLTNLSDELSMRPVTPREPVGTRPVTPPPVSRPTPPAPAPAEKIEKIEKITTVAEPDQNLAEMANRLEPSLRRPTDLRAPAEPPVSARVEPTIPPPAPRITPESRIMPPEPRGTGPDPRVTAPQPRITPPEQKPARAETKPKAVFDSLEEEMASLLGRPPGKT